METDTCLQPYNPFHFYGIGTRVDANIYKTFACRYLSNNICTVVEEWTHGYFCLGYFPSSTQFDLVMRLAQKAWRQCALVFVHDLGFRDGNCIGLLANTGLFLSTGNRHLFLPQRRLIRFDSLPRLLIQFSHVWSQSSVIAVSDLNCSASLFSTFHSWEPISSDEISMSYNSNQRFQVDQTHVFSICTDFPTHHRMSNVRRPRQRQLRIIRYRIRE